jgi:hypothetical protein
MKIILNILFIIVAVNYSFSQFNITDPDYDQSNPIDCGTIDASTPNFFDDGGNGSDYSLNFNDTITFCPDLPNGPKLAALFGVTTGFTWDVDATDTLYVFLTVQM